MEGVADGSLRELKLQRGNKESEIVNIRYFNRYNIAVNLCNDNNKQKFTADVEFVPNRYTYQTQSDALDKFIKLGLYDKLISPTPVSNVQRNQSSHAPYTSSVLNEQQIAAVQSILMMNGDLPFVLFGPPGTGKTKTLVAAAEALSKRGNKIMVCAQSNSMCDELALRLLKALPKKQVIRIYATNCSKPMPELIESSNYDETNDTMTRMKTNQLANFRVIICTVSTSGKLFPNNTKAAKKLKFNYLFIDEAASVAETMTLIPITGKQ